MAFEHMKFAATLAVTYGTSKKASTYTIPGVGVQSYLPVADKRKLTKQQLADIEQGESQWLPRIFQSYGTPAHELLSSPGKGALLHGLGGAAVGGLFGTGLGTAIGQHTGDGGQVDNFSPEMRRGAGLGGVLGALTGGGLAAALSYFRRKADNEGIKELMARLPAGATKRDLMADPVYQKDLDRASTALQGQRVGLPQLLALHAMRPRQRDEEN